jgi:beta-lactamase regulating signal transducer with metallopeptidase domain
VDSERLSLVAAAWLLTYTVHSTVLLGGALFVDRLIRRRSEAMLETVWRIALFGPLLTATLQFAGMQPFTWRVEFASGAAGAAATSFQIGGLLMEGKRAAVPGGALLLGALGVYLAVVVVRLAWLIVARHSLTRLLSDRVRLTDQGLTSRALHFSSGSTVTISASSAISSPIIVGRSELCLPWRAVSGLTSEELDAVLAHEIAHLRRSDGAWLWAMLLVERIFWIQPLNRLAVARLHTLAECFCDDWALRRAVPPVALASALARVAEWMRVSQVSGVAVGMATRDSLAVTRVRRILDVDRARAVAPRRILVVALATVMLAGITAVAPGFAASVVAPYTITAHDDGGPFTLTMRGGEVVSMTMDGIPVDGARIHRAGNRVIVDAADNVVGLALTLKPDGGIRWTSRPPRRIPRQ